ncbi:MAG: hypothetical protein M5U14_14505 [Acidimicrobiia bacterium]|nr:hypothetical protein [Acidimicrobiia bacterium]
MLSVELVPGGSGGVTAWGETLVSPPGERIYGLTERIVDDYGASELAPRAVGGLDRKGETVTMWVRPTISAYAPFHHSSVGYGLLVDGTMPGTYDLGATDPARVAFEFELDPGARAARYFVIPGRGHDRILDGYTALVGRPVLPPESVFDHWLGHDELPPGEPVLVDGVPLNPAVADDLLGYERHGIPAGVYHFDRPWAVGSAGYGAFAFDPGRFPDPVGMLGLLRDRGWRSQVWISEWALDDRAAAAAAYGWLAPGSDRVIDLTHPDAAAWLEEDLVTFLEGPEGSLVDGFFLDRTDEVVPSEAGDVYHDGRNGRQVHNAYPVLAQEVVRAALDRARDSGGWLVARAAYTGSSGLTMTWGGDTHSREGVIVPEQPDVGPSTDLGLRSVLVSLQRAAFMGLVYWGSDIGGYNELADREVYARWIEVGALSPLMRFHGKGRMMPWNMPTEPTFDEEMLGIYRRYVVLHHALGDYLYGLAERAHETGAPIARPLVFDFPDDPRVGDLWDQWMLGPDLLVAPVWESGARRRPVYVPAGTWVDFWDRDRVVVGPADLDEPVPLDRVPLFVREGSPLLDLRPPP